MIEVNLNTVCGGYLAQEFEKSLPTALEAMKSSGKPVSMKIMVTFKPIKEMEQTFTAHAKFQTVLPVIEIGGFCQLASGGEGLVTESPVLELKAFTIEGAIAAAEEAEREAERRM